MENGARHSLRPLFFISAASIGFEILLTRYFAVAEWSEYGYWVISMAMVGYSFSGVFLCIFKDFFVGIEGAVLRWAPPAILAAAICGYHFTTLIPFNPLELQNPELWRAQLGNILLYYLALFPFFFLTGIYVGIYFLAESARINRVYMADLVGAGLGSLAVLGAMFLLSPFRLIFSVLPLFLLAALAPNAAGRRTAGPAAAITAALLLGGGLFLWRFNHADFNIYKPIYPPLHVKGNTVRDRLPRPQGYYLLLENFTERRDLDLSNNYSLLGVEGPPPAQGLYKDGYRIASIPLPGPRDEGYLKAALGSFPYLARRSPKVLLVGSDGGFRAAEALALGASSLTVLEPEKAIGILAAREGRPAEGPARALDESPHSFLGGSPPPFDIIEISPSFLDTNEVNRYAFTVEAIGRFHRALSTDGILAIPVSIREFTFYALKVVEGARRALEAGGAGDAPAHIAVYRSAWTAVILVRKGPFTSADTDRLESFCGERSFDVSWYKGRPPRKTPVWNDLPAISFEDETSVPEDQATDSLAADCEKLFSGRGESFLRRHFFNLEPATDDRPFFHAILRLGRLPAILSRIQILPREEMPSLINLAVLAQALLIALTVLLIPLLGRKSRGGRRDFVHRGWVYFASLGLGYLVVEIALIEKFSFFLYDRTSSFGLVLAGMLIFSGLGSLRAGRYLGMGRSGIGVSVAVTGGFLVLALFGLDPLLGFLMPAPYFLKVIIMFLIIAPLSFAMGFPFPLGLSQLSGNREAFLPWAWGINGAFSVVATPLANLSAVAFGYRFLFLLSLVLYLLAFLCFPTFTSGEKT